MNIVYNHSILPLNDCTLTLQDRGFLYGDGVFETLRFQSNTLYYWDAHWDRMDSACSALDLLHPFINKKANLYDLIIELIQSNSLTEARIKIIVRRQSGGFYSPEASAADLFVLCSEWKKPVERKQNVFFIRDYKNHFHKLSAYKTLSSMRYIIAGLELKKYEGDEAILVDIDGNISECLYSNIFWIKNNTLYTPGAETGCIEGIRRKQIIDYCIDNHISLRIGSFRLQELLSADTVFTANVNGFSFLESIENRTFQTSHPWVEILRDNT